MRAFARARRLRRTGTPAAHSESAAGSVWGEGAGTVAARLLAMSGVALGFSVAGLRSKLGASDVGAILFRRAAISASMIVFAVVVSSLRLFAG
jgi:hypothetical protein